MRCLYEVLSVDKAADDDTIKKAYRKAALIWHPDKNQHRLEEADAHFKEIQNAYEVLSDKHERVWYDSHRDQILRSGERHQAGGGGGGFTPGERPDDEIDLFQYFSSSCYSGFGDGPKGFYGVYSELFKALAEQEAAAFAASDAAGAKNATAPTYPSFGSSDSAAAEVFGFYRCWESFVTYKDFAWADPYNPAQAPNRQVRRKMEDENRKARRVQRREYLDNVRELVAFVKKRDKRVAKFQAEEAVRRAEQQAAEAARRAAEREERLRRAAEYEEPDWVKASEAVDSDSEDSDAAAEEQQQQQHFCIVCEKRFRSAGQLANHERSRAHREALAALMEVLQEEEAWLLLANHERSRAHREALAALMVLQEEEAWLLVRVKFLYNVE
ncbi:hypothetical protein OEZ86_004902 [Tetradesmus obliquus]|nr:hypothetical protein OEZ86_004902 [Tetradesmus obliquus]